MSPSAISPPNTAENDLPNSNSPALFLDHPTRLEKLSTWSKSETYWRGALPVEAYFRREVHLSEQAHTRDGGITYWVLVDRDLPRDNRPILSTCESIRKKALVSMGGRVEEVVTHGIGNVFCAVEFRKRGYAGRMMK